MKRLLHLRILAAGFRSTSSLNWAGAISALLVVASYRLFMGGESAQMGVSRLLIPYALLTGALGYMLTLWQGRGGKGLLDMIRKTNYPDKPEVFSTLTIVLLYADLMVIFLFS